MYLSRVVLDPRRREVRRLLADCQQMHAFVMRAFADDLGAGARSRLGVLYRVEPVRGGAVEVLVQSRVAPDWSFLDPKLLAEPVRGDAVATKSVGRLYAGIGVGDVLAFRLRANPTRKIDTRSGPAGERRTGQRVELRDEEALIEWLRRKGREGGFEIIEGSRGAPGLLVRREPKVTGLRPGGEGGTRLTFAPVVFEGVLQITDAARFQSTLASGVGPAKAYGFGLLSVAPPGLGRG